MTESMGPIADRSHEHLCKADKVVAIGRRVYLKAVRAHMRGERALGIDVDVSRVSLADGPEHATPARGRETKLDA